MLTLESEPGALTLMLLLIALDAAFNCDRWLHHWPIARTVFQKEVSTAAVISSPRGPSTRVPHRSRLDLETFRRAGR